MENISSMKRLRVVGAESAVAFLDEMIRRLDPQEIDKYNRTNTGQKFITCIDPWKRKIYRVRLNSFDFKGFDWGGIFDDLTLRQLRAFARLSDADCRGIMIHGKGKPQLYVAKPRPLEEMPIFPDYVFDPALAWSIIAHLFGYQTVCEITLKVKPTENPFHWINVGYGFTNNPDAVGVIVIRIKPKPDDREQVLNIVHRENVIHHEAGSYT